MKNEEDKFLAILGAFYSVSKDVALSFDAAIAALLIVDSIMCAYSRREAIAELSEWILALGPADHSKQSAESSASAVLRCWDGEKN